MRRAISPLNQRTLQFAPRAVRWIVTAAVLVVAGLMVGAEQVDLNAVHRIKNEAFENSKVMEHLFYLTDVHGPRLTNSPGFRAAADWTVKRLQEYGLTNVKLEKFGPYGRGWSHTRFSAHLVEPGYTTLIGFPLAWSPGTDGVIRAEPIHASLRTDEDLNRFKGKLKDRIVLIDPTRETPMRIEALGSRYNDDQLEERFLAPTPGLGPRGGQRAGQRAGQRGGAPGGPQGREAANRFRNKRNQFLKNEGALALLTTGLSGDGGTLFGTGGGSREPKDVVPPPMAAIIPEHYNRIVRLLEKKIPVKLELEIVAQFHDETLDSFNIVGELPGLTKKDEVVMLGAHFDSWHGGTGATDNAAGSAVMIEAMRILKAIDAKMDRTVRIALWGGEEQGLLGSKAYVKEHFADPETMVLNSQHARLAGYFNYDNGTGRIRGVYLQGNDMMRPVFEDWMAPFKDLGMTTLAIRNTTGTDHLSFDAVGLPGFQFIQDPIEYASRTHHSNMDVYDRIQPGDVMQAAAIVASFVYNTATRSEMLPRKPLPKPQPRRERKGGDAGAPDGPNQ